MCFRPADVNLSQPIRCPLCGKINRPDAVKCIKCGATEEDMVAAMGAASPTAPSAPSSPDAPKAPAPKAPGAALEE